MYKLEDAMTKLKVLPKRVDILDANDPSCRFRINIDGMVAS